MPRHPKPGDQRCAECSGSGRGKDNCYMCQGGKIFTPSGVRDCNVCNGTGKRKCSVCGGTGRKRRRY